MTADNVEQCFQPVSDPDWSADFKIGLPGGPKFIFNAETPRTQRVAKIFDR